MARKKTPKIEEEPSEVRTIGYARVSMPDQSLETQTDLLLKAGVLPDDLYTDKISAVGARRRGWELCKKALRPGDTLLTYSLSRLGRTLQDLLNIEQELRKEGVILKSLTEPLFDTSTADGKLLFNVRAAFAQFERDITRERTRDSMRRRKEGGLPVGRPGISDATKAKIRKALLNPKLTLAMIAKRHGVAISTIKYHFPKNRLEYLKPDKPT